MAEATIAGTTGMGGTGIGGTGVGGTGVGGTDVGPAPLRWFLGVPFTPMSLDDAARCIAARDPDLPFCFVSTPNAQHVVNVHRANPRFTKAHDAAWLVLNDSTILSLLARKMFSEPMPLAAGSDLTVHLFRHYIKPDDAITIIGCNDEVEPRLREQFGMKSIARYNPPMGFYNHTHELDRCVDFILAHPAKYVFISVGAPQSETLALHILERGGATGVGLCVGSSLHFLTGIVKRAPAVFRYLHMEAAYRLWQNPRRHARRVFVESMPVLWIASRIRMQPRGRRSHVRAPDRGR